MDIQLILHNTENHDHVHSRAVGPYARTDVSSVHALPPCCIFKINFNIILPHITRIPTCLFRFYNQNRGHVSLLSHACHIPYPPSQPPDVTTIIHIWQWIQITNILVMQCSTASCYLLHLSPQNLLSTLFSNTLSPYSFLHVRHQFSAPM